VATPSNESDDEDDEADISDLFESCPALQEAFINIGRYMQTPVVTIDLPGAQLLRYGCPAGKQDRAAAAPSPLDVDGSRAQLSGDSCPAGALHLPILQPARPFAGLPILQRLFVANASPDDQEPVPICIHGLRGNIFSLLDHTQRVTLSALDTLSLCFVPSDLKLKRLGGPLDEDELMRAVEGQWQHGSLRTLRLYATHFTPSAATLGRIGPTRAGHADCCTLQSNSEAHLTARDGAPYFSTLPLAQDPASARDQNEFRETSAKDPPESIPFDTGDSCEKSHYANPASRHSPSRIEPLLLHATNAWALKIPTTSAPVDHLHRIRQACHRSQASPAVILVGSALATLGSTTGTTPADPRATPYLPSPSIIPLAPPATPSVLLPLDRAWSGFYRSALTLSPYRSVRPLVSLGRPYPYTPPNENSGSLVEAQGENDVPLKGWRTEVEF
ncbi:hypothetical protein B0H14DRAFT_2638598, partial [Mycena olivaceomarginata]